MGPLSLLLCRYLKKKILLVLVERVTETCTVLPWRSGFKRQVEHGFSSFFAKFLLYI